jgi:hypothetical protein
LPTTVLADSSKDTERAPARVEVALPPLLEGAAEAFRGARDVSIVHRVSLASTSGVGPTTGVCWRRANEAFQCLVTDPTQMPLLDATFARRSGDRATPVPMCLPPRLGALADIDAVSRDGACVLKGTRVLCHDGGLLPQLVAADGPVIKGHFGDERAALVPSSNERTRVLHATTEVLILASEEIRVRDADPYFGPPLALVLARAGARVADIADVFTSDQKQYCLRLRDGAVLCAGDGMFGSPQGAAGDTIDFRPLCHERNGQGLRLQAHCTQEVFRTDIAAMSRNGRFCAFGRDGRLMCLSTHTDGHYLMELPGALGLALDEKLVCALDADRGVTCSVFPNESNMVFSRENNDEPTHPTRIPALDGSERIFVQGQHVCGISDDRPLACARVTRFDEPASTTTPRRSGAAGDSEPEPEGPWTELPDDFVPPLAILEWTRGTVELSEYRSGNDMPSETGSIAARTHDGKVLGFDTALLVRPTRPPPKVRSLGPPGLGCIDTDEGVYCHWVGPFTSEASWFWRGEPKSGQPWWLLGAGWREQPWTRELHRIGERVVKPLLGKQHTNPCALFADGRVRCERIIGDHIELATVPAPLDIDTEQQPVCEGWLSGPVESGQTLLDVIDLDNDLTTCALTKTGRIACWGELETVRRMAGKAPRAGETADFTPRWIGAFPGARRIATTSGSACVLERDGHLSCTHVPFEADTAGVAFPERMGWQRVPGLSGMTHLETFSQYGAYCAFRSGGRGGGGNGRRGAEAVPEMAPGARLNRAIEQGAAICWGYEESLTKDLKATPLRAAAVVDDSVEVQP